MITYDNRDRPINLGQGDNIMSDMLKITTPILPKNYVNTVRSGQQSTQDVFNLVDLTKVTRPNDRGETQTNNTLNLATERQAKGPLSALLSDPGAVATSLKRLIMLSIVMSRTAADSSANLSLDSILKALMLREGELLNEILSQQQGISAFQGAFFDELRALLASNSNPQLRESIGQLLKAITGQVYAKDILDSISANLSKFADLMKGLPSVADVLDKLSRNFNSIAPGDPEFSQLKDSLISVLREINESIYANEKTMSLTTLIVYNLSKFVNEKDAILPAFEQFSTHIPEEMREPLRNLLMEHLANAGKQSEIAVLSSKVIEGLSQLIEQHISNNPPGSLSGTAEVYSLLQSLAAAPTVFTPLLHYILPLANEDTTAFAELWVDPEDHRQESGEPACKVFFTAEVEGLGHLEFEMLVTGNLIDMNLFCPKGYEEYFIDYSQRIAKLSQNTSYTFSKVQVLPLDKERRLEEIFPKLMNNRSGVDVRV